MTTTPAKHAPPKVNQKWFDVFAWYGRRYLAKNFHGVRLSLSGGGADADRGQPPFQKGQPVVVYCNHPSWWDPMILIHLTQAFLPERTHYAPIDAAALEQYKFFAKIGFFGVEQDTRRGPVDFLRKSEAILNTPNTALWVTAEGEFTDPRKRPVQLKPGVAHLAQRMPSAMLLPIALEYTFWDQPKAEALMRSGEPIQAESLAGQSVEQINETLTGNLQHTMDALASEAQQRNPEHFDTLIDGQVRVSLVYDAWRGFWARLRGKRFSAKHRVHHGTGHRQGRKHDPLDDFGAHQPGARGAPRGHDPAQSAALPASAIDRLSM